MKYGAKPVGCVNITLPHSVNFFAINLYKNPSSMIEVEFNMEDVRFDFKVEYFPVNQSTLEIIRYMMTDTKLPRTSTTCQMKNQNLSINHILTRFLPSFMFSHVSLKDPLLATGTCTLLLIKFLKL